MTPFPLAWPENMPRTKHREPGRFQTTLAGAMNNVADSIRRFGADSGKAVTDLVISSNVTLGVNNPPQRHQDRGERLMGDKSGALADVTDGSAPPLHRYVGRSAKAIGITRELYVALHKAGKKWCTECRDWHLRAEFSPDPGQWDGRAVSCRASRRVDEKRYFKGPFPTGHRLSDETRAKMSAAHRGERSSSWKGGITPLTRRERQRADYQRWRREVIARDGGICRRCDEKPVIPHAHHIKHLKTHSHLRLVVSNGLTLCPPCHRLVHQEERHLGS